MAQRKILIVTNRIPWPLKDGGNLAMHAMIEGYYRAGWKVYLLSMNTSRHHIKKEVLQNLFGHLHAFEWLDYNNSLRTMDIVKNFFFSNEPEHAIRFYSEAFEEKIKTVLKEFKPDIVQMESVYLTTYLPVVRAQSNAIGVLRMHNVEYQVWQGLAKKHRNWFKRFYLNNLTQRIRNYERAAWKEYDLLLPITEKDGYLVTRLEDVNDMVVAPFSIDAQSIKPAGTEKWDGYHIGAMDWLPNKEGMRWFLQKAWPLIRKAVPKFEFYFAGRNMPEEFRNMRLHGAHCMNEVPSAEDFIADKKILIVPIWSGGGIRVKILEAMAAGKVVITTATGIKGIEAKSGEHYIQARKAEDFAKAIKWCLDNKEAAERMAANAHALVREKYDYDKVTGKVIAEMEVLLGDHRH